MTRVNVTERSCQIFSHEGMIENTSDTNAYELDLSAVRKRLPGAFFIVFRVRFNSLDVWQEVATIFLDRD